jgi:hypothetical protein
MKKLGKNLIIMFCILNIWACDQKSTTKSPIRTSRINRDGQQTVNPYNTTTTNTGIVQTGTGQNTGAAYVWGRIYSPMDNEFNLAIKALMSASMDPSQLGYVNSQNGIVFQGFIDINQNMINPNTSNLTIVIKDSYALSGQASEITLSFPVAKAASELSNNQFVNNQFSIAFEDPVYANGPIKSPYGAIILEGTVNGGTITGRVLYKNYTSFDGSSVHEGILGAFEIQTCGFVRCG